MSDEAMVTEHSDDQHGEEGQAGGKVITVISCHSEVLLRESLRSCMIS